MKYGTVIFTTASNKINTFSYIITKNKHSYMRAVKERAERKCNYLTSK